VGAYKRGALARLDEALDRMPKLDAFLRQPMDEPTKPEVMLKTLQAIWEAR
jgi:flagellar biosynthesis/type III secretory pathway ATPase